MVTSSSRAQGSDQVSEKEASREQQDELQHKAPLNCALRYNLRLAASFLFKRNQSLKSKGTTNQKSPWKGASTPSQVLSYTEILEWNCSEDAILGCPRSVQPPTTRSRVTAPVLDRRGRSVWAKSIDSNLIRCFATSCRLRLRHTDAEIEITKKEAATEAVLSADLPVPCTHELTDRGRGLCHSPRKPRDRLLMNPARPALRCAD